MSHIDKPWDNTPPDLLPPPPPSKGGLKPPPYAGSGPDCDCTPPPPPPPVAPAHWIPGANWQEQMNHVMERTNEAICRWNQISADCYKALHDTVDAAISNDVYYDRDEVNLYCGYDEAEESTYYVISARAVDKKGEPIRVRLAPAFNNTTNSGVTQKISDVSYITNANAIITAVSPTNPKWAGPAMRAGGAMPGETIKGGYVAGFNMHGVLKVFSSETDPNVLYQNKMVDVVGPVLPLIQEGQITAAGQGMTELRNICIIGWRRSDGMKFFFWSGNQENPGMSGVTAANILIGYGCTTAVATAYEAYEEKEEYEPRNGSGMEYMATMPTAPMGWAVPSNSAFWYITKRPFRGWKNRFEGEIADLVQKAGQTQNDVNYIGYKVDTVVDIANEAIQKANKANDRLDLLEPRVDDLETRMAQAETNINGLRHDLNAEIQRATNRENQIEQNLNNEINRAQNAEKALQEDIDEEREARIAADQNLQTQITDVQNNLTQEIKDRTEADTNLNNAILAEQLARSTADTRLENLIEAEEAARQLADSTLQQTINNIIDGSQKIEIAPDSLPIATPTQLGAIKVGENLTITEDGVLNAQAGGGGGDYTAGPGISISGTTISTDNTYLQGQLKFLPTAGGTMTGDIVMTQPAVVKFNNGTDIGSVYADGNDTCLKSEAGDIRLLGSNIIISDADNGAGKIKMGIITIEQHANETGINHLDINVGTDAGSVYINRDGLDGGTGELWLTEVHAPNELRLNPGTNINAMNHRITGVADPTQDTDALTLKYFNEHGGGSTAPSYTAGDGIKIESDVISVDPTYFTTNPQSLPYLPLAGGTMTGAITRSGELVMADANKTAIQVQNQNIGGDNSSFAVLINGAASNTNFSIRTNRTVADSTDSTTVTNNIRLGLAGDRSNIVVLDMGGMPIVNLGEPTKSHDAVTLGYLQTNVGTGGPFLPLAGGTMTGGIIFPRSTSRQFKMIGIANGDAGIITSDINDITISTTGDISGPGIRVSGGSLSSGGITDQLMLATRDSKYIVSFGKMRATDLGAPTETNDAVTLGYLQTNVGTGPFLPLSGGTMTGNITGPQSWNLRSGHATNYSRIAFGTNQLQIGIGTVPTINVSGQALSMLTHRIVSLGDPIDDTDAVNRGYLLKYAGANAGMGMTMIAFGEDSLNTVGPGEQTSQTFSFATQSGTIYVAFKCDFYLDGIIPGEPGPVTSIHGRFGNIGGAATVVYSIYSLSSKIGTLSITLKADELEVSVTSDSGAGISYYPNVKYTICRQ